MDDFDTQIQCEEASVEDFYGIVRCEDEDFQEQQEQ